VSEYLQAFGLGNAAILGNVCLLPLYPGLFALLAAKADREESSLRWMGVFVLAGILTVMIAMAAVLSALNMVFADTFNYILPVAFGLVFVLGILMLLDKNPLARLGAGEIPLVKSPAGSAFIYGAALGPMTLPCTGPVILSAFVLGGVGGTGELLDGITYFVFFGLGFGWPLVLLPLLAGTTQRRFSGLLTRNHLRVTRVSGALLMTVAVIGFYGDFIQKG
jgi:cytochrome c-type biogenesis protein